MFVAFAYLQTEKNGRFYYRRKFPKDLAAFIPGGSPTGKGRIELKVSLRSSNISEPAARAIYAEAEKKFASIVEEAKRERALKEKRLSGQFDELDVRSISYLASLVVHENLLIDEEVRLVREPSERKRKRAATLAETSAEDLAHFRELRAISDIEGIMAAWSEEALSLAEAEGLNLDPQAQSFVELCNAINDAQIAAWEGLLARSKGDLVPTPQLPAAIRGPEVPSASGKRYGLLKLYERYASTQVGHPKTIAQWRPYIADLVKFLGDDDALAVGHEQMVAWRNYLRDEKTHRGRHLSAKTINDSYLAAAKALFSWAKGDGIISTNPMLEVTKVKAPAKTKTRGKAFTSEEANKVLKASLAITASRESEDLRNAKRWCPWLMAYSGARVNEITQLRKEDIFEEEGIIVMRLTPDAGTIKDGEFRLVPLHSHLLAQGFLAFVQSKPDGPLFFDPAKRRSDHAINRQANRVGSKLAEWVRSLGIEGVKPNHAWRHLFVSQAPRFQMDPRTTRKITGHSSSDVHERDYLYGYLDVMAREIEKMPRFLEGREVAKR
jgi:integrase